MRITTAFAAGLAGVIAFPQAYEPTEAEQGLIAWAKLNFDQSSWMAMEGYICRRTPALNVSIVDEHRFMQEAHNRGVRLSQISQRPQTAVPSA